jgi:hypothetical protein
MKPSASIHGVQKLMGVHGCLEQVHLTTRHRGTSFLQAAHETGQVPMDLRGIRDLRQFVKDRRRRPEGGEWEPVKIPLRNLAYIPKSTRCPSLLTRSRPHSYSRATGLRNRFGTTTEIWNGTSKTTHKINNKTDSKNSLYPHSHFTEHLMGMFEKSPWEYNLNHETSSLLKR